MPQRPEKALSPDSRSEPTLEPSLREGAGERTARSADARTWRAALARRPAERPARSAARPPVALAIVVPCFDEAEVLPTTVERLADLRSDLLAEGLVRDETAVWFVDDGSRDETWSLIETAARALPWVHGIKLSRNRGHQNALLAGVLSVEADAVVTVDADLQDDLSAIREMLARHREGAEIVYGVRRDRRSDTAFKRLTAEGYYRLLHRLGVDVVFNHADYRLMGRAAVAALASYGEVNLFLRGIIPQLGFPAATVEYERAERFAGESKYPLRKMLTLAWNGLTSFSTTPLRWITAVGFVVSALSFGVGCWAVGARLLGHAVSGWASTVVPIVFLGGVQLLSLGMIGEYLGKAYAETKRRPRFVIEKRI